MLRLVGEARWLHTTRVANVAMSKFDANSEMPYEKLVKNLEVVEALLNRPLTLSEKVFFLLSLLLFEGTFTSVFKDAES
jgi:hypothetical protein